MMAKDEGFWKEAKGLHQMRNRCTALLSELGILPPKGGESMFQLHKVLVRLTRNDALDPCDTGWRTHWPYGGNVCP
jgi:hypothetical protein